MSPEPEIVLSDLPDLLGKLEIALPAALSDGTPLPTGISMGLEGIVADVSRRAGYAVQFDGLGGAAEDVFDAMTHADIYGKVSEFDPQTLVTMANNWRTIGGNASTDAGEFASEIGRVVGQDWQGVAADAAGAGVQRYAVSAVELMIASHTFSSTVASAHDALEQTKSSVPPPQPISKTDRVLDVLASVGNLVVPGSMKTSQFERDEAEEQARTIMKTLYQPAIRDAGDRIPVLPQALDPLNGGDAVGADAVGGPAYSIPYGGSSGAASSGGGATSSSGGSLPDAQDDFGGQAGSTASSSASTPHETATQAANWSSGEPGVGSPSTTAAGTGTGGATTTGGGSMLGAPVGAQGSAGGLGASRSNGRIGSGGAGGIGASGGFGTPPRGGSLGGSQLGGSQLGGSQLGGSALGGPGGSSGGAGGIAGAAATQGRPGAPGMGATAPSAGRGATEGDDVHKTPGYLVDAVNGDELIGTLPLVAPPVLGE